MYTVHIKECMYLNHLKEIKIKTVDTNCESFIQPSIIILRESPIDLHLPQMSFSLLTFSSIWKLEFNEFPSRWSRLHSSFLDTWKKSIGRKWWHWYNVSLALNNCSSPFYLTSVEHPGAQMVPNKFTREGNYITRANAMRLSLIFRCKLPFITGKIKKPANILESDFEAWEIVNGLILSWILNLVSP